MESESIQERVLVTGASGFIASHVIFYLLEKNYLVRGTVRSLKNPKNVHIYEINPSKKANIELVEADLMLTQDWKPIVSGCDYIMHVASPFPSKPPKNANELIEPAVTGTKNVILAGIANKVKKIVITSSVAAIIAGHMVKNSFTEEDWSIPEDSAPYEKSKFYAEKEVWKIYNEHKGDINITTINPSLVLGPTFSKYISTSGDIVTRALKNDIPGIPRLSLGYVDVRDVALAHVNAMKNDASNGKRYILSATNLWFEDAINILKTEFNQYGYCFPKLKVGYCPLKFMSIFDSQLKLILPFVGRDLKLDNSQSVKELGIQYRDIKQTLIETGYSFIDNGIVPDKREKEKK